MLIYQLQLHSGETYCQLQAHVQVEALGGLDFTLWYRFSKNLAPYLSSDCGDPFVAAMLLTAMATGEVLEIDAAVSPQLLHSITQIQQIYCSWNEGLKKVNILPKKRYVPPQAKLHNTGSFFSGGIDSFYTLIKNHNTSQQTGCTKDKINQLILIRGFDIPITENYDSLFDEALERTKLVAGKTGTEVTWCSSNFREFSDLFADWRKLSHGAFLASVGLALQGFFQKLYIASTYTYADLFPLGSNPLIDPLWSIESLTFVHDGCEAKRLQKISYISRFPVALQNLRVCYQTGMGNNSKQLNCGRCEKCLRTMIGLHVCGVLQQTPVFPEDIDVDLVSQLPVATLGIFMKDLYQALGSSESDLQIKQALVYSFRKAGIPESSYEKKQEETTYLGQRLYSLVQILSCLLPDHEKIIWVDDEHLRKWVKLKNPVIPFLEKDGAYWGAPADSETAIRELTRLQQDGTRYLAIAWTAFWWLEYYTKWTSFLLANFSVLLQNDDILVFDLQAAPQAQEQHVVRNLEQYQSAIQ